MALVTTKDMFAKALTQDYAVGAFNVNNMEIIQGIVEAAKEEKAPLILQVSAGARKYAKPVYLVKLVEAAIEDTGLDIALHLDHGEDFDICKKCVDDGFTSVMIDGSKHPFEENIRLTKEVVEYAHSKGVSVEPNWVNWPVSRITSRWTPGTLHSPFLKKPLSSWKRQA